MCGWDVVAPEESRLSVPPTDGWGSGSVGDLPQIHRDGIPACSALLAVCLKIV